MTFSEHKGTSRISPPTSKTSSSQGTLIKNPPISDEYGMSWSGASWLRSQQLAEEEYNSWRSKNVAFDI